MLLKRQEATLSVMGRLLLGLAGWSAFLRGWAFGAKATIAGVFGISYLLTGVLALYSDSVPQLFRRAIYSLPVAYLGRFVALQSATVLANKKTGNEYEPPQRMVVDSGDWQN